MDVGNSAFATTILAALFPIYLPSLLPKEGIQFALGSWIWQSSALSLWAYTVSGSLFITFIISPVLGAWADRGGHRKKLFSWFTFLGATSTILLSICSSWKAALFFFVLGNIGFSGSTIFYNSLLTQVAAEKDWHKISLRGFAWGYIGGGVLLAINLLTILKYDWWGLASREAGVKVSFFCVGLWWMIFSFPAILWIKENEVTINLKWSEALKSFHELWRTLKGLISKRNLLLFMLSYALFNDGIQTVISMASLFGKEVLALNEETLIGTLLLIQFLGLPFTLSMNFLTRHIGAKRVLMISLFIWIGILAYAYRMTTALDFWVLGILVAFVLGVSQSLPRSIFASLIPKNKQAEYFSFYALSGKMTSVLGPLFFGIVKDAFGDARISIAAMGLFFILGVLLLSFVSIDPAKT